MSGRVVALVCEDQFFRGFERLIDALRAPGPRRRAYFLTSHGNGRLIQRALDVARNGLPDLDGRIPDAVAIVADVDRAYLIDRSLSTFEKPLPASGALGPWVASFQQSLQRVLREQTYEDELRQRLFAFVLCWSMESVALSDPDRLRSLAESSEEHRRALEEVLARCAPNDPRGIRPEEFAAAYRKPGECFKDVYRAATGRRPGKERVSDLIGDLAGALPRDVTSILARVPGLDDLVAWLDRPPPEPAVTGSGTGP